MTDRVTLARRIVWFAGALGLRRGVGPDAFLMGSALPPRGVAQKLPRGNFMREFDNLAEGLSAAAVVLDGQS